MTHDSEFGTEYTQDDALPEGDPAREPGEYEASDQLGGMSEDTGVAYEDSGEPETTPHDALIEADVQDSNPGGASAAGLQGDMGISSERTGPYGGSGAGETGIEGTGSHGSAAERTDGTMATYRAETASDATVGEADTEKVGTDAPDTEEANTEEANTAEVPAHEFDARKNPGHSHG